MWALQRGGTKGILDLVSAPHRGGSLLPAARVCQAGAPRRTDSIQPASRHAARQHPRAASAVLEVEQLEGEDGGDAEDDEECEEDHGDGPAHGVLVPKPFLQQLRDGDLVAVELHGRVPQVAQLRHDQACGQRGAQEAVAVVRVGSRGGGEGHAQAAAPQQPASGAAVHELAHRRACRPAGWPSTSRSSSLQAQEASRHQHRTATALLTLRAAATTARHQCLALAPFPIQVRAHLGWRPVG